MAGLITARDPDQYSDTTQGETERATKARDAMRAALKATGYGTWATTPLREVTAVTPISSDGQNHPYIRPY